MHLLIVALAVLWAWEYLLILSPVRIHALIQPVLVAGAATQATRVPDWILFGMACAGAVALAHRFLSPPSPPQVVSRRSLRGLPPL